MSTKENNHINDLFSEAVKQKMEDFPLPVDENCWKEIEQKIKPKRKPIVWWVVSSAVAASVALFFILHPFQKKNIHPEIITAETISNDLSKNLGTKELVNISPISNIPLEKEKTHRISRKEKHQNPIQQSSIKEDLANEIEPKKEPFTLEKEPEFIVKKKENVTNTQPIQLFENKKYNETDYQNSFPHKTSESKWLIAATVGSGNGNSSANSYTPWHDTKNESANMSMTDAVVGAENILPTSAEKFSETDYLPPLSLGFSVRKELNRYFSVESGLTYTYLRSKFKTDAKMRQNLELNLHYLGIPLNISISPWNFKYWDLYLSVGGMVEKGLIAKYSQDVYIDNQVYPTEENTSIDGWQWSVNASLGISYLFAKNWGIYFEPRIAHYFDNNQPVSIRTESSVVVGFNLGLRYIFLNKK